MQPTWLVFLSRNCQYINLSELPARTLPIFFSNLTPASRAQRVTWGCCSYFLLPKLISTLGLFHQVIVDAKTLQVRAKSQAPSSSKNKWQVERDPKNVFVRAAIKQRLLSSMCVLQTYMRLQTSVNGWTSLLTWLILLLCLNWINFSCLALMNVKVVATIKKKNKKGTWKH